ncbi:hypothetical protein [Geoalkalibacter subterraneus]|uniref:Uncharacterized protein n=1 Tax=Geoalkalibacter subterraneus TaxID=483547 RepID=A0A0B5FXB5_9BACT|nr:hypothetical protein [Geoalkalibacter subterraneus]AJF08236.1 hypothetical protein GSUB_17275 [Geoalkalibacter subterraneus]
MKREEIETLLQSQRIDSQLPLHFDSTDFTLTALEGDCAKCQKSIEPQNFRGHINTHFKDIAIFRAIGICHQCRTLTPFIIRIRADGRFETMINNSWRQGQMFSRRTWRQRIASVFCWRPRKQKG